MAELTILDADVADWQATAPPEGGVAIWWLGQAGFAVRYGEASLLIDPYLSDSLARRYAGAEFPHVRMMPSPLDPATVAGLSWVFCTHAHSDHLDPDTVGPIARSNPDCRFVVPRSAASVAVERGSGAEAIVALDDGESAQLAPAVTVEAVASAHEQLQANAAGEQVFLGYVIRLGGLTIYHSGDCVPYAGLAGRLAGKGIDLAMLPVNGRDEYRASRNVPGNFHFGEAFDLCVAAGIPLLVVHHFGMFDFNTIDPARLAERIAQRQPPPHVVVPQIGRAILLGP
jgi:L-ascorbate metabolism protein UlaG (beta-lactamase superfamily)